jgi:hypothetical protein
VNQNKTLLAASICAALAAGSAQAATFNVTTNADAGAGSLRQALIDAGANAEADIIELSAISGQTIALSSGALYAATDEITVNGAGVTIDAGGNSRVLEVYAADLTLNDLTITGGDSFDGKGSGPGGGVYSKYGDLTLNNTTVTGNTAGAPGGGIAIAGYDSDLSINDSVISGNTGGTYGGGLFTYTVYGNVSIAGSTISGNSVAGGGLQPPPPGPNDSGSNLGQRLFDRLNDPEQRPAALQGEPPGGGGQGGGGALASVYGNVEIIDSTVTGNSAAFGAGLVAISGFGFLNVEASTFSANQADEFGGAGVLQAKYDILLSNSTVSGNSSGNINGGIVFYSEPGKGGGVRGDVAPVRMEFTTVTGNSAVDSGGVGISSYYGTSIVGSVISGNTAATDPDIGFEPGSNTTADVSASLIGVDSASGTLSLDAASAALLGQDPLLGSLADNGGPTFTHLPGAGSPLIDAIPAGDAGCGTTVAVDQRGETRPQGNGCDIGALENLAGAPPLPEILPVPVLDRFGLWLMAGLLGLAGLFGVRRERASRSR